MNPLKAVKPYLDSPVPLAIAHRGFSLDGLENTLPAFRAAVELGCQYLETDINTTADGVTLVFHDATLDRITDRDGTIAELPYAVVGKALIGGREHIATLREFFMALPAARFNIDVKDAGSVAPLAQLIEEMGLHERVCVASFSDRRRREVVSRLSRPVASSAGQKLLVAYFVLERWMPAPVLRALMRNVDVLQIPVRHNKVELVTRRSVARAHRLGLKMHVWTINDPGEMNRLLDLGVDGIMTDRADLLAGIMRERGCWPGGPGTAA
ncbi:glycerophosphodiester phosphodiesterase [Arthrobacter livingstonensis]|uniref:glycerophosphodiester phosphodiesterase n=1 Tax=Arthrobacter livingstonensis TaxID=670078 RepID=UPI001FE37E24|nr:glycerophosphodiester phosphodiesterase [Arthrobacter livingstonensis]